MTSSSISPENAEFYELFSRCNHTELYQIARRNGFVVLPSLTRDELIRVIIYENEPPRTEHTIDEWRRAVMRFIIDHRKVLETQITCPAKSFQEDACFGCVDAQVISCVTSNGPENYKLIKLRRRHV